MKQALLTAAALLAVTPALAAPLECTFTAECFETDGCHESGYGFMVWFPSETSESVVTITDGTGDFPGLAETLGEDGLVVRFTSGFGPSMLTLHGDAARLAAHGAEDALMVNYSGACREVEE
ncbi:hypothetical protein R3X27_02370 [Tropicimonas sp. TH_r6]|uniref:hypothetical protein n=1 Tax=Tropicimonas sp. TH_r6 TaxID=3082085 RepID=UPI0029544CFF|nr:hypothetical protein [Tropicimonas sp. TH_r6]MDV7141519.1 hypothetical protein [Tropicimonas sp. TH_r6]